MAKFVIFLLVATFLVVSQQAPVSPEAPAPSSHNFDHNIKNEEHQVSQNVPNVAKPGNLANLHHILTEPLPVRIEPQGHDSYHGTPSVREASGSTLQDNKDSKVSPSSSPAFGVASSATTNGERINAQANSEGKPVVGPVPNFGQLSNSEGVKNGLNLESTSSQSHHLASTFQHGNNPPSHHLHTRDAENKQNSASKPSQAASTFAHENKQAAPQRPAEVHQSGTPTYFDPKTNKEVAPAVPQVGHQLHARDAPTQQKPAQIASSIAQTNKQLSNQGSQASKPLNTQNNQNKPSVTQNKPSSTLNSQAYKPSSSSSSQSAHSQHKRDVLYEDKPAAKPAQIASSFSEQSKKPATTSNPTPLNQQNKQSNTQNTQYKPSYSQNPSTSSTTQSSHSGHKRSSLTEDKPAAKPAQIATSIADSNKPSTARPSSFQSNSQNSQNKQTVPQNVQSNAHQVRTRDAFPQQNAPKPIAPTSSPSRPPNTQNFQNNKPSLSSPVNPSINRPTSSLNLDNKPISTTAQVKPTENGKPVVAPGAFAAQGTRVTREVFAAGSEDDLLALASDNLALYDSDRELDGKIRRFRVLPAYLG